MTIGEPVTRIPLDGPERKPEPALDNPIRLSARQTKAVLKLLERNEAQLREMSEEEEEVVIRALGKVYLRLIRLAEQEEKSKAADDEASQG